MPSPPLTGFKVTMRGGRTEVSALLGIIEPPVRYKGAGNAEWQTGVLSLPSREPGLLVMRLVTLPRRVNGGVALSVSDGEERPLDKVLGK